MKRTMLRRSVVAGGAALLGGCLGGLTDGSSEVSGDDPTGPGGAAGGTGTDGTNATGGAADSTGADGTETSVDTASFERITVEGVEVPLAPVEVTRQWHEAGTARFADARGETSYEQSHVEGAVWSPAPDGRPADPVADWPTDARIVCYCGCPHHLSSMRAAALIGNGYENVYVIDEGFWEWMDRGYPVAGSNVDLRPELREIRGVVDAAHAGGTAWAWHEPTGQREATAIGETGEYTLELHFSDVTSDSEILVETPAYRVRAPLGRLVDGTVTAAAGES